ncbi:hypothetical protein JTE90_026833 [Oedothorax gibbosus]|uniref:SWIM-type domain-containing protein n=1 Tax=Oedothorax gibbosus TaxID=931172 RepID=A0AAV6V879_9ARAC|nr:hypothetical protein JTE90_026833 [Oedothorax gibbosus]
MFKTLVLSVQHSQRLNEKPLEAWIVSKKDSTITAAHCSCVAGLSESCSHVGAMLFWIQDYIQRMEAKTVTDVPEYWVGSSSRAIKFSRVQQIDFCLMKKRRDDTGCEHPSISSSKVLRNPSE